MKILNLQGFQFLQKISNDENIDANDVVDMSQYNVVYSIVRFWKQNKFQVNDKEIEITNKLMKRCNQNQIQQGFEHFLQFKVNEDEQENYLELLRIFIYNQAKQSLNILMKIFHQLFPFNYKVSNYTQTILNILLKDGTHLTQGYLELPKLFEMVCQDFENPDCIFALQLILRINNFIKKNADILSQSIDLYIQFTKLGNPIDIKLLKYFSSRVIDDKSIKNYHAFKILIQLDEFVVRVNAFHLEQVIIDEMDFQSAQKLVQKGVNTERITSAIILFMLNKNEFKLAQLLIDLNIKCFIQNSHLNKIIQNGYLKLAQICILQKPQQFKLENVTLQLIDDAFKQKLYVLSNLLIQFFQNDLDEISAKYMKQIIRDEEIKICKKIFRKNVQYEIPNYLLQKLISLKEFDLVEQIFNVEINALSLDQQTMNELVINKNYKLLKMVIFQSQPIELIGLLIQDSQFSLALHSLTKNTSFYDKNKIILNSNQIKHLILNQKYKLLSLILEKNSDLYLIFEQNDQTLSFAYYLSNQLQINQQILENLFNRLEKSYPQQINYLRKNLIKTNQNNLNILQQSFEQNNCIFQQLVQLNQNLLSTNQQYLIKSKVIQTQFNENEYFANIQNMIKNQDRETQNFEQMLIELQNNYNKNYIEQQDQYELNYENDLLKSLDEQDYQYEFDVIEELEEYHQYNQQTNIEINLNLIDKINEKPQKSQLNEAQQISIQNQLQKPSINQFQHTLQDKQQISKITKQTQHQDFEKSFNDQNQNSDISMTMSMTESIKEKQKMKLIKNKKNKQQLNDILTIQQD